MNHVHDLPRLPLRHRPRTSIEPAICENIEERPERQAGRSSVPNGRLLEAQRLEQRTHYDLEMMQRDRLLQRASRTIPAISTAVARASPPYTLLDYFPKDFLLFIDESHVTIPQIRRHVRRRLCRASRSLVDYGFRLPSAFDNRPLRFARIRHRRPISRSTSRATPGPYELEHARQVVEQIIRPTGSGGSRDRRAARPQGRWTTCWARSVPRVEKDQRVLVTTLTKKMAESLTQYLRELDVRVRISAIPTCDTLDRVKLISRAAHGRVRRAGGHQPAARGPGHARGGAGGHLGHNRSSS